MKTVIVTGASRGIGNYLFEHLAGDYDVWGLARTVPDISDTRRFIQADVSDREQLTLAIKAHHIKEIYGLVNCAGIASMNLFLTTPWQTIEQIFKVNSIGTMNMCAAALPFMIRNHGGRIVNFSTIAVGWALEGEAAYVASKAAVEAFSRVLAKEVSNYNITVNIVAPNPVDTDLIAGIDKRKIQKLIQNRQTVKRMGEFRDVLNVVRFYLDEQSSMISGQRLVLGGE